MSFSLCLLPGSLADSQDGFKELAVTSSESIFLKHVNIYTLEDALTPERLTPVVLCGGKAEPTEHALGQQSLTYLSREF